MAKIEVEVKYNANDEVRQIIELIESYVNNMNVDKEKIKEDIQKKFQEAFNEGRKFQRSHGALTSLEMTTSGNLNK